MKKLSQEEFDALSMQERVDIVRDALIKAAVNHAFNAANRLLSAMIEANGLPPVAVVEHFNSRIEHAYQQTHSLIEKAVAETNGIVDTDVIPYIQVQGNTAVMKCGMHPDDISIIKRGQLSIAVHDCQVKHDYQGIADALNLHCPEGVSLEDLCQQTNEHMPHPEMFRVEGDKVVLNVTIQ